ncbi:helix-turn-helix transcriptional regulator [Thermus sp.]|uniref:helix-turn-helix domain-containing protein n=1 Tax=Thermus sp. TaxID=275 RepID=UPI0032208776
MGSFFEDLGRRLASFRRARNFTQEDLAELAGLDRSYVSQLERGLANPSLEVLLRIAQALEIDVCALVCGEEDGHEDT